MEIELTREREAQLEAIARQQGKIEEGWQQSERGEVVDGEESRRRIEARHAGLLAQSRRG